MCCCSMAWTEDALRCNTGAVAASSFCSVSHEMELLFNWTADVTGDTRSPKVVPLRAQYQVHLCLL